MKLIPWKSKESDGGPDGFRPTEALTQFHERMDDALRGFFDDPFGALDLPFGRGAGWTPAVDVTETGKEVKIKMELPGVEPGEIDVQVTGDLLTVSGEKREEKEEEDEGFLSRQVQYGSFRRSVTLPAGVDPDSVKAKYARGVLTLRLKKLKHAAARRIPVKQG